MLRERHPVDKLFEEIAVHFPKMDARLEKIDGYLEDEQVPARYFRVSHQELAMGDALGASGFFESLSRVIASTLSSWLLGAVGAWAPGVLGAALMVGLAPYAWQRLIVHPEPPVSDMILLGQEAKNETLPGQLEVELSV